MSKFFGLATELIDSPNLADIMMVIIITLLVQHEFSLFQKPNWFQESYKAKYFIILKIQIFFRIKNREPNYVFWCNVVKCPAL